MGVPVALNYYFLAEVGVVEVEEVLLQHVVGYQEEVNAVGGLHYHHLEVEVEEHLLDHYYFHHLGVDYYLEGGLGVDLVDHHWGADLPDPHHPFEEVDPHPDSL